MILQQMLSKRKCKNTMGQMFSIETTFVEKALLAWFDKKIKSQNLEIDAFSKMQYERKNPANWKNDKCVICKMPLRVEPTSFKTPDDEMTFGDFIIHFEHKFIWNIYAYEQIKDSHHLQTCEIYQKFVAISIGLLSMFNNYNKNDEINTEVSEFIEENYTDDSIDELKNCIMQTEIKNALKSSYGKDPKFNLEIYTFVCNLLFHFPVTDIQNETFTTDSFFINVHCLIKTKVHLHHSHITGKILGYTHDFWNLRVKENIFQIPVIAHNLFGFDLCCFIKGYVAFAWCSEELKIGWNNFTHINFSNITGEIKFIDSLKYYQKSLAELVSTLSDEEKMAVKKLTEQFFNQHYYFSTARPVQGKAKPFLDSKKKEKKLEIVSDGKGVIPYELVIGMEPFLLTLENEFWEKTEFFSDLKQSAVNENDYENSKYLYQTLKMRNVGDMNDLYNAQDVILLCEIIENRFQIMNDTYGFNPRKFSSASSMSGYI